MKEKNKNFKRLMAFAIAATMCLTALAIVPTTTAAPTMFLLEDFSGGAIPATWIPEEAGEWEYQPNGLANITVYPSFSPCMGLDWTDVSDDYSYIDTESVDTSTASDLTLRFSTYISDYAGGYDIKVYVRADSIDTWTEVTPWSNPISGSIPCYRYTIDITSDIGSGTQVRFEYDGNHYNFNWWHIDDVQIYGETGGEPWPDCKMHYPQLPDPLGWDVFAMMPENILADDFNCTESGPITDLHFWGSWYNDLLPPPGDGKPDIGFHFSIHEDIPADESPTGYSMPGTLLWEEDVASEFINCELEGESPQGWFEPPEYFEPAPNHFLYFRYDVSFVEPFIQEEGTIYWVDIAPMQMDPGFFWGWKTSLNHFNDDAVYSIPSSGSETLLEEGFENYNPGSLPGPSPFPDDPMCYPMWWHVFDNDADGYAWDSYTAEHHTGDYSVSVRYNGAGQDDWLLTPYNSTAPAPCPMIHDTGTFDFWAMSCSSTYLDDFEVLVWDWVVNGPVVCTPPYTGWVSLGTVTSVPNAWTPYSFALPGTMHEITVAIRCISVDQLRLAVDDISMPATGWSTSFEGTPGTPAGFPGWTENYLVGTTDWEEDSNAHSGSYAAEFNGGTGDSTEFISPAFDGSAGNNVLTFWHIQEDWSGDQDTLEAFISNDGGTGWTSIAYYDYDIPTYTEEIIDLDTFITPSANMQVKFTPVDGYGHGIYLDDVKVTSGGGTGGWGELIDPITMESLDLAFVITGEEPLVGTIIVEKQTIPDGAADSFTFTGDAAGTISDDGQIIVSGLSPGTYTSTEIIPAGWTLTSIVCDDADSYGDVPSGTVTFNLQAGETVTAVFTNTKDNNPPNAVYTWADADGTSAGTTIDFDASGSSDPSKKSSKSIITYEWDWTNDGSYDYTGGPTASHDYGDTLEHDCTLRVTDDGGLNDTFTDTVQAEALVEQLDINQSASNRGFPIRHTLDGDWGGAQNFTPTLNVLTKVEIYLRMFGTPEFDLTVELRKDSPTGTLLDTVVFTTSEVPSSWDWLEVDFTDQNVGVGSDVFIVCPPAPSGVTTSFGYEWGYAFGNQYDDGSFWFTRDSGALWRDLPTMYEFTFRTYGLGGVVDTPPNADYTWADADGTGPGTIIDFDASGSSDDNGITTYEWDWDNDGTYDYTGGPTASYNYTDTDPHDCTLRVTDTIGQNDTFTDTVQATVGGGPSTFFEEDFESGQPGWTRINTSTEVADGQPSNWILPPDYDTDSYYHTGTYGAYCHFGYNPDSQDEWLISPVIDLSTATDPYLSFWWETSYYWEADPYDNFDVTVQATTDGGTIWTEIWNTSSLDPYNNFEWYDTTDGTHLSLASYAGESNVQLAWRFLGGDSSDFALDDIRVYQT